MSALPRPSIITRRAFVTCAAAAAALVGQTREAKATTLGFDPGAKGSGLTIRGNGFTIDGTGNSAWRSCLVSARASGELYMELQWSRPNTIAGMLYGLGNDNMPLSSYMASDTNGTGINSQTGDDIYYNSTQPDRSGFNGWSENNIMQLLASTTNNWWAVGKDNVFRGTGQNTPNPVTHTFGLNLRSLSPVRPGVSTLDSIIGINPGNFPFILTPPSGYGGWNTGLSSYTAGVTYLNPSETGGFVTLSQNNLRARGAGGTSGVYQLSIANRPIPAASRAYMEFRSDAANLSAAAPITWGLRRSGFGLTNSTIDSGSGTNVGIEFNASTGVLTRNGTTLATLARCDYVGSWMGWAVDRVLDKFWLCPNGTWDGNPETNTGGYSMSAITGAGDIYAAVGLNGNSSNNYSSVNFGGYAFQGSVPSTFSSYDGTAVTATISGPRGRVWH
jgi:hypothetical protein